MDKFSNEMIFYSGLAIAAIALTLGIVYAVTYFVGKKKLNAKFDVEYGEAHKKIR